MNIFLWVLQILLSVHTFIEAVWKFSNSEQIVPSLKLIPHELWQALIAFELLWGLALILPAFKFKKDLAIVAPIAAVCVAMEMVFFCGLHVYSGTTEYGPMIYWSVVAFLCAFIAYGRFVLRPFSKV